MIARLVASLPLLLVTAGLAPPASALILVESRFDADAEGWTAVNGVSGRRWNPVGGQSGGFYEARDDGQGTVWFFSAPAPYLGDQTRALGGTLSFWLKTSTLALPMDQEWADVKIGGNGLQLALDAGPSPGLDWTFYSLTLGPGAWRVGTADGPLATEADFRTVLANVEHLRIRGEYSAWWDQGGIDTVLLSAVPAPPALWMAVVGLAGVLSRRRPR
jgi:alkaline phosphatase D